MTSPSGQESQGDRHDPTRQSGRTLLVAAVVLGLLLVLAILLVVGKIA